ncbi:hypothetical protein [Streptomyces sp. NPDC051665]|uniref:hypothetical protein n=1 Tax=Streptomyces sp. NPDC051665 TaxID=3154647 RepID=UPI0034185287
MDVDAAASVGSVADSYVNAMTEALNGTFKAELIEHRARALRSRPPPTRGIRGG